MAVETRQREQIEGGKKAQKDEFENEMKGELQNLAKNDKDLVKSKYDKRLELVDEAERYRTLKAQGSMFHDDEIEVVKKPKETSRTTTPAFTPQ